MANKAEKQATVITLVLAGGVFASVHIKGEGSIIDEKGRVYLRYGGGTTTTMISDRTLSLRCYKLESINVSLILPWKSYFGPVADIGAVALRPRYFRLRNFHTVDDRQRMRREGEGETGFTTTEGTRDQDCGNSAISMGTLTLPAR